jgi:hypothetical protein
VLLLAPDEPEKDQQGAQYGIGGNIHHHCDEIVWIGAHCDRKPGGPVKQDELRHCKPNSAIRQRSRRKVLPIGSTRSQGLGGAFHARSWHEPASFKRKA